MNRKDDIADDELFQTRSKEEKEKLDFFWEHCMPLEEEEIVDSIQEKTFLKIQRKHAFSHPSARRKIALKVFYISAVAASVALLLIGPHVFKSDFRGESIKEAVALMDTLSMEEAKEVVLVVSDREKHQLAADAQVSYTAKGKVLIDSGDLSGAESEPEEEKISYKEVYNQLIVPKGKRSQLLLSDGTKVWVNAGTRVVYPRVFNEEKREIYVEGEIYIEVTPDADRPFYVNTNGFEVKVLGTAFDVFAYKEMTESRVVLIKGSVEIEDVQKRKMQMAPNELVSFRQNVIMEKKVVNAGDYTSWMDGVMVLKGVYLRELTDRLGLHYGVKIVCDPSLDNEQIYGKLDLRDDLEEVMDYIKTMISFAAREENGVIYLKRE